MSSSSSVGSGSSGHRNPTNDTRELDSCNSEHRHCIGKDVTQFGISIDSSYKPTSWGTTTSHNTTQSQGMLFRTEYFHYEHHTSIIGLECLNQQIGGVYICSDLCRRSVQPRIIINSAFNACISFSHSLTAPNNAAQMVDDFRMGEVARNQFEHTHSSICPEAMLFSHIAPDDLMPTLMSSHGVALNALARCAKYTLRPLRRTRFRCSVWTDVVWLLRTHRMCRHHTAREWTNKSTNKRSKQSVSNVLKSSEV